MTTNRNGNMRPEGARRDEETLADRLRSWAQNEEMIDQHFTAHGRDCERAAEVVADLLAALEMALRYIPRDGEHERDTREAAEDAIARAKGA